MGDKTNNGQIPSPECFYDKRVGATKLAAANYSEFQLIVKILLSWSVNMLILTGKA